MATTDYLPVTDAEFDRLFAQCCNWRRWGPADQLGALNLIGGPQRAHAARLVRRGTAVSCARPLETDVTPDNPVAPVRRRVEVDQPDDDPMTVLSDFLGLECHGEAHSHVDALCHIGYRGRMYNGWPINSPGPTGGLIGDIAVLAGGITGRGVLLDLAADTATGWLEPGIVVYRDDLDAAEQRAGLQVSTGDIVLVRTGQALRRKRLGPWDSAATKAGLHPSAMPWFKERDVAALGFDGDGDVEPHRCAGPGAPIHVLGIAAMGLHFFDALDLDDLAQTCHTTGRYEFLFTAAPPRLPAATGSAINPIALF
jgi:kynurenine formamidase